MKKLLLSLFALMAIGVSAWADGTVTVPNSRIAASRFTKLQVTLASSSNAYRDLQFDLTLPEGITLKDEAGGTVVDEASNHIIDYKAEGSTIHFVVVDAVANLYDGTDATNYAIGQVPNATNYGKTLSDGIVVEIPVSAAASFTGEKSATLSNVKSSTDAGANVNLANADFTIKAILLGDVNDDTHVDPTDALNIQLHYLEATPSDFVEAAGYVNDDEAVDPTDALEVQLIYLSSGVKRMVEDVDVEDVEVEEDENSELDPD